MCFFGCMGIKFPMMSAGLWARQHVSGDGPAAISNGRVTPAVGVAVERMGTNMS